MHLCLPHYSQGVQRGDTAWEKATCETLPLQGRASEQMTGHLEAPVEVQAAPRGGAKGEMEK